MDQVYLLNPLLVSFQLHNSNKHREQMKAWQNKQYLPSETVETEGDDYLAKYLEEEAIKEAELNRESPPVPDGIFAMDMGGGKKKRKTRRKRKKRKTKKRRKNKRKTKKRRKTKRRKTKRRKK